MAYLRHYRNNILIEEPRNWQDLEIEINFLDGANEANINIASLEFVGNEAKLIRERIFNGLLGGTGVFEGDPYRIEVGENGNPAFVFEGYLDYASNPKFTSCNIVQCALKKRAGGDWLNDVADGYTFRFLASKDIIKQTDYKKVPYVINFVPDGSEIIMLSLSLYVMTKELSEITMNTSTLIAEAVNANTPVTGVAIGVAPAVVTAWDLGDIITFSLKVAANLIYSIAIIIAIKNLIDAIFEQLYPNKRYHLGISILTLLKRGCEYLGLTLVSNLLEENKNWIYIPSKNHKGGQRPQDETGSWIETGVPSAGDPFDTLGDFIRYLKQIFNADYKIVNGVFYFERKDFWDNSSSYQLPDYFTNQDTLDDTFSLNTNEIISNYLIYWAYDATERNTLVDQKGRVFQITLEPEIRQNQDLLNLKGLTEIAIPCALGSRKDDFTPIEILLKSLGRFVDGLTGLLGGGTNYASMVEARRGCLMLSAHEFEVPKMVVMSGDKLAANQREILSGNNLWHKYHFLNCFAEINNRHNQYYLYEGAKIPFCVEDFIKIASNNHCTTVNGEKAKIDSLTWRVWDNTAIVDYRVNKKYTNNLKIKYSS